MKKMLCIFCVLCFSEIGVRAQMTLQISLVPQLTPLFDNIYIAGNFNDWNPGDPAFQLAENDGEYSISITAQAGELLEFKFTRGSWATVEGNALGAYMPNRNTAYTAGEIFSFEIAGWEDIAGSHTVTPNVRIVDSDMYIPQLERTRRIWICLPENYESSTTDYPVIYMHDSQNLFDQATSFAGEWESDESMIESPLSECIRAIIVGVDNGGSARIDEYAPWVNQSYQEGGEGQEFASFIAQTLKPLVDENFRTLPDREHTFMMGSSLGALITMYTVVEYNEIFSGAALLSPAFWFNEEIYDFVTDNAPAADSKFYFVCGDSESSGLISETQEMHDIITSHGINGSSNVFDVQPGGTHNEYWWNNYFPEAIQSLISCNNGLTESGSIHELTIFPNPSSDLLEIRLKEGQIIAMEITDSIGKGTNAVPNIAQSSVEISSLRSGKYNILVRYKSPDGKTMETTKPFIKN